MNGVGYAVILIARSGFNPSFGHFVASLNNWVRRFTMFFFFFYLVALKKQQTYLEKVNHQLGVLKIVYTKATLVLKDSTAIAFS